MTAKICSNFARWIHPDSVCIARSLQEISGITKCLSMNDVTSDIIVVRSTSSLIWKVFQVFSNNTRLYAIDQKQNIYLHKIITIVHLFTLNTLACMIYFHVNILACLFRKWTSYTYWRTRHKQNLNANHDRHIIDIHYLKSVLYADRIKEPNILFFFWQLLRLVNAYNALIFSTEF